MSIQISLNYESSYILGKSLLSVTSKVEYDLNLKWHRNRGQSKISLNKIKNWNNGNMTKLTSGKGWSDREQFHPK